MKSSLNRKIVVAVLAFFLAISVGYAIFSETITIEGTATAQIQEKLDIEASCITNVTGDMLTNLGISEPISENGYKDVTCTVEGNTVSYSAGFDYPGATKYYVIKMKNVGQIPAYYEFNSNNSIFNKQYAGKNIIKKYDSNDNLIETITSTDLPDYGDVAFVIFTEYLMAENTNGNTFNYDSAGINNFLINRSQFRLNPGESVYLLMVSRWPDREEVLDSNARYVATNTLEFIWNQVVE